MAVKVYLDTNIVLDFFQNKARAMDGVWKFRYPKKMEFLIGETGNLEFVTSFLTKAEVARELASGFGLSFDDVKVFWEELSVLLGWEYIDRFCFGEDMVRMVCDFNIRLRTLMNFQHLYMARERGMFFVTGDLRLIETVRRRRIYDKIMSYVELRRLAFSPSS